ncbi:reverse transcriptase domain-containing protein [Tanacetum coccineum]
MADQRTMAELLRAPTEGYAEAIVVPPILAEHFELKHRAARRWLEKEPPRSILTWEDLVSKFINEFFPPSRMTNLLNEISNFEQHFGESFHEAWDRYKDLLPKLTHAVNQQTSVVTTAMRAILKQFQATPPLASVKAVEEICVTCGGAHPYYQCLAADGNTFPEFQDNIQGYVSAAAEISAKLDSSFNVISNPMSLNKHDGYAFPNEHASTSGSRSLPSNTVANPRGELKAITTRSGIVLDGPSIPMPHPFINPEEDERVEKTLTDPELAKYTIKVPPPLVQKAKPTSLKNYVVHQRDPLHPNIPYPSRMHQEKQQEKDDVQIHKFWQMFKQLYINISLAEALILIPKYQKMLKSILSNKEKLLELANTPLNENCSAVILKKLPEELGNPGKFYIPPTSARI